MTVTNVCVSLVAVLEPHACGYSSICCSSPDQAARCRNPEAWLYQSKLGHTAVQQKSCYLAHGSGCGPSFHSWLHSLLSLHVFRRTAERLKRPASCSKGRGASTLVLLVDHALPCAEAQIALAYSTAAKLWQLYPFEIPLKGISAQL